MCRKIVPVISALGLVIACFGAPALFSSAAAMPGPHRPVPAAFALHAASDEPSRPLTEGPWGPASSSSAAAVHPGLKTLEYVLDLRFDFGEAKLFGACRLTVLNPGPEPVGSIPLILYRLLKVTAVGEPDGALKPAGPAAGKAEPGASGAAIGENRGGLPFTQKIAAYEDWDRIQFNTIDVDLVSPIAPGAKRTIDIRYEGYLGGYQQEGILYVRDKVDKDFTIVRMDGLGYPQVGVASEQANRAAGLQSFDYRLDVTVPEGYVVANGGRLLGKSTRDGETTYSYRNLKKAWRMDAAIAKYKQIEDAADGLAIFYFTGDEAGAAAVMKGMKDTLALYSGWFGPLAEAGGLTIIEVPEGYGSQSDVTSILETRDAFINPDRMTDLYHELAHQWSLTALDTLPPRLESEGMAMLLQYVVKEKLEKKPGAVDAGAAEMRKSFARQCKDDPAAAATPMAEYGKKNLTDLSYTKGMLFFYVLYRVAGEKPFLDATAACYRKYRASGATLADYLATLEKSLGKDLSALYRDWVFGPGKASSDMLLGPATLQEIVNKYR